MDAFVGIDVGKWTLDVAIAEDRTIHRLANTTEGWLQLIDLLAGATTPCIVLEATNRYHEGVALALAEVGKPVTVANPRHTAAFRVSEGTLAKTDAIDARLLCRFAEQKRPRPTPLLSPDLRTLRDLERARVDLVQTRVRTQQQAAEAPPAAAAMYAPVLAALSTQIAVIDATLADLIGQDATLATTDAILQSMPGLGPTTSACLLANLPELGTPDRGQIASLTGLAPRNQESGSWVGRPAVWGGRARLRHVAFWLALGAVQLRRNQQPAKGAEVIRARYLALIARGKPPKLALIAIARWLVTILNVMVRDGLRWEETRAFRGGAAT